MLTQNERKCRRAKDLIESGFASPLKVKALAAEVRLAEPELRRGFVQYFGLSITQHLTNVRIQAAGDLLVAGNSVTDTARACGFQSTATLSAQFLKTTGIYASHYRFRVVGWKNGAAALERRAPIHVGAIGA